MESVGRALLLAAVLLAAVGLLVLLLSKLGVGRLPGDVVIRRGNFTLYAPIGLMVLVSVVLTIVLSLLLRR